MSLLPPGPQTDPQARGREQFGWKMFDWAWSTFITTVLGVMLGPFLTGIARTAAAQQPDGRISVLGIALRPEAFYPAVVTAATLIALPLMLVIGAVADRTPHKRLLLGVLAGIGAGSTMAFFLVADTRYLLGGLLTIVASAAYQCAGVVYNSFLPDIATVDERDRVSAAGWAFGYASGAVMLGINLAMVALLPQYTGMSTETAVRLCLLTAGLWWALWLGIPMARLRDRRPRAPLAMGPAVRASVGSLAATARQAPRFPMTFLFLLAFLLYKDGIGTIFSLASTFASSELRLSQSVIVIGVLVLNVVGVLGSLVMARIADRAGTQQTILGSLVVWVLVCVYGVLVPADSPIAFYLMTGMIALVIAGTQALSRSLYSKIIPRDREAEYFGLYGLGAQGTAWIGSLVFTLVLQWTGSYRSAIGILVVFFIAGGFVLWKVDVERGIRDAAAGPKVVPTGDQPAVG